MDVFFVHGGGLKISFMGTSRMHQGSGVSSKAVFSSIDHENIVVEGGANVSRM